MRGSQIYQGCCKVSGLTYFIRSSPMRSRNLKSIKEIRFCRVRVLIITSFLEKGTIEQGLTTNTCLTLPHMLSWPLNRVLPCSSDCWDLSISSHGSKGLPRHHTWDFGFVFPLYCLQREPSAPGCPWPHSRCSPAPLQPFLRAEQQNSNHKRKNKNFISLKGDEFIALKMKHLFSFYFKRFLHFLLQKPWVYKYIPWKEKQ